MEEVVLLRLTGVINVGELIKQIVMRNYYKVLAFLLISFFLSGCYPYANPYSSSYSTSGNSSDVRKENLCAKYQTQSRWSKGYDIEANIMKGSELNSRTGRYSYNALATYAIIFWANEQASIIKLSNFYGSFTAYGTYGTDQEGRRWQLSNTTLCY